MIVLIHNDVVRARGIKDVQAAERKGIAGERSFLPGDTEFVRIAGGFAIADNQPDGWADKKVRGEALLSKMTRAVDNAKQRRPKFDSTAGLIERVARMEIMMEKILEQTVDDHG